MTGIETEAVEGGAESAGIEAAEAGGALLSLDPPIVYTALHWSSRMRWIDAYEPALGNGPAAILIYRTWHLAGDFAGKVDVALVRNYRAKHPHRELHFLCSAPDEVETMARFGEPAFLLNHNLTISERVFRPLPGTDVVFDAIYTTRASWEKRIELAAAIDRVAYVTHVPEDINRRDTLRQIAHMRSLAPAHVIVNQWDDQTPIPLKGRAVNEAYNRAAVGLCLSEVEGAMLSSMEYMLSGLPIVSTPSLGGRDFFFDPEYCLIAPPDPRSVRDAVAAMKARQIPREYIRRKTLARVEPQRRAFLALLDGFLGRHGYAPRFGRTWPWQDRRNLCGVRTLAEQVALTLPEPHSRPLTEPA